MAGPLKTQIRWIVVWGMLLLCFPISAWALDRSRTFQQYHLDVWTTEQGLPHDKVQAIAQTPDSYLWVATGGGIVRFDGVRFSLPEELRHLDLLHQSSRALLVTRDGSLWFGTDDGTVGRLSGSHLQTFRSAEPIREIRSLYEDERA